MIPNTRSFQESIYIQDIRMFVTNTAHLKQGIPTIGVGFNLRRPDAASIMGKYGLILTDVLNDCEQSTPRACLTEQQATEIFKVIIYPQASDCASRMPTSVHAALTDIAFAGCGTLNQFVKMRTALINKQWRTASNELKTSKWCANVRSRRCGLNVACIA